MSGYRPGDAAYRRATIALFAAAVTTFALLYAPQAVLPEIDAAFALPAGQSVLAISVTTAAMALALLAVGPVTERFGRTPVIIASVVLTAVVGLALPLAPTWPVLLGLRALQGVSLAGTAAVAMAYLREEVAPDAHARATGLYVGGTAIGGMLGRFVVGGVGQFAGWRWALAALGALGLTCAVVVRLLLPPSRNFHPVPMRGDTARATLHRLLTDPALLALYGIAAVGMGALIGTFNGLAFRLREGPYQLGVAASSLVYLTYASGSLSSAYAGRVADRRGRRAVLPAAVAVMLAGLLVTLADPLWVVLVGLTAFTSAFFAMHGIAAGWVAARAQVGGGGTGQATAFYLVAYYTGSSVFGGLAGVAWSGGRWPAVVALAAALVVVALGLAWALTRIPRLPDASAEDPGVTAY
ncbi:MAG: MFS transporter [Candidatus Phosphoribacter sp.]|nr:MFS transporter [Actinomycetales bacterium]